MPCSFLVRLSPGGCTDLALAADLDLNLLQKWHLLWRAQLSAPQGHFQSSEVGAAAEPPLVRSLPHAIWRASWGASEP